MCTVRECVCATATHKAKFAIAAFASDSTVAAERPDSTECKCDASFASSLSSSFSVVSCRRLRLASAAAAAAAALVAAGQPQLANVAFRLNASIAGTCPTRTAVCIAAGSGCDCNAAQQLLVKVKVAPQRRQRRQSMCAKGRQRESETEHAAMQVQPLLGVLPLPRMLPLLSLLLLCVPLLRLPLLQCRHCIGFGAEQWAPDDDDADADSDVDDDVPLSALA